MRVLFGINNDDTVKSLVKFYEDKYNEKIEYKNVYYFKQFISELSTDKYDRAVLLEELEQFPTNNYAQIDEYLFKNIDDMTDVFDAKNLIYIAADRRRLGDEFLTKLFYLGVYTTLTGQNRTKGKLAAAINEPFTKKDVKKYYNEEAVKDIYNSNEVSEIEIQRIISYYMNQNGATDRYNEIFNNIASQYTDEQLKIIIKFLPEDVKKFLSANNEKYKMLLTLPDFSNVQTDTINNQNPQKEVLSKNEDAKAIEIKKEPEIVERIVVRHTPTTAPVITEVVEKEVLKSVYKVPKDYRKVVCFVGAPKTGTTFCINAIATFLARNKVKTAIIDMTRSKDTYTMYTYDNEGKRNIAAESLKYASNGLSEPLIYEKLSIYTAMPGEDRKIYDSGVLIDTIMQENNVVLIDTDFTTPADYFRLCQEIYLVQDMDILNIPQVTIFLRELKNRGVPMSKLRIIINKHVKCALTAKDIVNGIATYTSYDLKMYDELFNSSEIPFYILPFEQENYAKYVEMVYKYSNKFDSFTSNFRVNLNKIINAIYPIGTDIELQKRENKKKRHINFSDIFNLNREAKKYKSDNSGYEKVVK